MISTLKEFFLYILNPTYQDCKIKISKFSMIFSFLILTLLFNGTIILTRSFLIDKGMIPQLFIKDTNPLAGFLFYPLVVLIISPIVEELGFRLFFILNHINIAISFSILFYFLFYLVFPFSIFEINIYLTIPPTLFLLLFTAKHFIENSLNKLLTKHFKVIFYLSTIFYTCFHLINFKLEMGHIIWLPFVFLPYLMLGLVLGYIRIKLGIVYGIIFHCLYNFFPFFLILFFQDN